MIEDILIIYMIIGATCGIFALLIVITHDKLFEYHLEKDLDEPWK